jgi:hypothetical protein
MVIFKQVGSLPGPKGRKREVSDRSGRKRAVNMKHMTIQDLVF